MHALSTISSVVGRYGKPKSISCDIRYSCSLLNHGSKNNDDKASKQRMFTSSEPALNVAASDPRVLRQNKFIDRKRCPRKLFCRPSETMLSENYTHPATSTLAQDGPPVAHYTINIFVNSSSSASCVDAEKSFTCSQTTLDQLSVDKLTRNITSNHALIEQFFGGKEFDQSYLEERMQKFWRELFESSKVNLDVDEEKLEPTPVRPSRTRAKIEGAGMGVCRLPPLVFPDKENVYANLRKKDETEVSEGQPRDFIAADHKPIYANKFFKSDRPVDVDPAPVTATPLPPLAPPPSTPAIEENPEPHKDRVADEQDAIFEEIPCYDRWSYDTRIVKATKISAPDNQRDRLTHDNDAVSDKVQNLVKLATAARKPEGRLSRIVNYCMDFVRPAEKTPPKAESGSSEPYPACNKMGPCYDARRRFSVQHNQCTNYFGKREYSNRKQFFKKRKSRKSSKDVIKTFERSRHCLAGAAIERDKKPWARANADEQKKCSKNTNLAKNASKGHFGRKLDRIDFSKRTKTKSTSRATTASAGSRKSSKGRDTKSKMKRTKDSKGGYKAPYNSAESVFNEKKQLRGYKSETNLSRASTVELHVHPRSKSDVSLASSYEKVSACLPNLIESKLRCDELPKTEYINEDVLLKNDDTLPVDVKFDESGVIRVPEKRIVDGKVFRHIQVSSAEETAKPSDGVAAPQRENARKPEPGKPLSTKILRKSKRKRRKDLEDAFRAVRDPDRKAGEVARVQGRVGKRRDTASLKDEVAKMEETVQILEDEVSKFEQCLKKDEDGETSTTHQMMDSPSRIAVDNFEKRFLVREDNEEAEAKPPKPKTPSFGGKTLSKRHDENTAKVLGKVSNTDCRPAKLAPKAHRVIPEKGSGVTVRNDCAEKKRAKSQTILSAAKRRQPKRIPLKNEEVKSTVGKKCAPKMLKLGSFVDDKLKGSQVKKAFSIHGVDFKKKLDEKSKGDCYRFTKSTTIDLSKPVRKASKKNDGSKKERKGGDLLLSRLAFADLKKKTSPHAVTNKDVSNVLKKRESCLLKKIEEHVQKMRKSTALIDLNGIDAKTRIPTRTRTTTALRDCAPFKKDAPKKADQFATLSRLRQFVSSNSSIASCSTNSAGKFANVEDRRQTLEKIGSSATAFRYNPKAYGYGSQGRPAVPLSNRTMATSASKLRKTSDSSLSADQQRRSMSSCAEKRPMCPAGKKKKKKDKKKQEFGGSQKKLAKRVGDCPAKPLEYPPLEPRSDEVKIQPAVPKEDIMKDVQSMMDCKNEDQLTEYFGQGGYANCEYYKYTRSSFYDLNKYMAAKRIPQPSSGAKPK